MDRGRGQHFVPNFSPKRSQEKSWSQCAHEVQLCDVKDKHSWKNPSNCEKKKTNSPFWGSCGSPDGSGLGSLTDELIRASVTVYSLWKSASPRLFPSQAPTAARSWRSQSSLILWGLSPWEPALGWQPGCAWLTLSGWRVGRAVPGCKIRPEGLFSLGMHPGQAPWRHI